MLANLQTFYSPKVLKMANSVASYDQLAHQVEALRKENFHLRKELEDNSNHLSKLENETSDMKVSVENPDLKDIKTLF